MSKVRRINCYISTGAVVWVPRATLATLFDSLHIILRHVRSNSALPYTNILFPRNADTTDRCSEHPVDQFRNVNETHAALWVLIHTSKTAAHKKFSAVRSPFSYRLSRSHSDSGVISRWPKTRRYSLSFCECQVNTRLIGTKLCLFENG